MRYAHWRKSIVSVKSRYFLPVIAPSCIATPKAPPVRPQRTGWRIGTISPANTSKVVATIGGQVNVPAGIGTVTWSWKDDSDIVHTHFIEQVHYFPGSPVNILGITAFGKQLNERRRPVSTRNGKRANSIGKEVTRD